MTVSFLPDAESDLLDAVAYYNSCVAGLGLAFAAEVARTIDCVSALPFAWTVFDGKIRRCGVNRFPYSVLYTIHDVEIVIIAVMHHRREPNSWRGREL